MTVDSGRITSKKKKDTANKLYSKSNYVAFLIVEVFFYSICTMLGVSDFVCLAFEFFFCRMLIMTTILLYSNEIVCYC